MKPTKFILPPMKGQKVKVYCKNNKKVKFGIVKSIASKMLFNDIVEVAILKEVDEVEFWQIDYFLDEYRVSFLHNN